jgi:brefeldin A-resistance guanine nucleotide exchange factor 1
VPPQTAEDVTTTTATAATQQQQTEASIIASLCELLARVDYDEEEGTALLREPLVFLRPFLDVIRSERTSGPVTGVALSSIFKLLNSVVCVSESGGSSNRAAVSVAMSAVAHALAECRFEATDPDADQATLSKLLRVLLACVSVPCGALLSDAAVMALFDTCLRLAVPHRSRQISPILRSFAENVLIEFVQTVFSRFAQPPQATTAAVAAPEIEVLSKEGPYTTACLFTILKVITALLDSTPPLPPISTEPPPQPAPPANPERPPASEEGGQSPAPVPRTPIAATAAVASQQGTPNIPLARTPPVKAPSPFWALAANFSAKRKAEAQFLALNMASAVVEVCGSTLAELPGFLVVVQHEFTGTVLQLLHSPQPAVLALALRVLVNLFSVCRPLLKMHFEMFLMACFKLAVDPQGSHQRNAEVVLQTILELVKSRTFVVELYANYDCDPQCSNLLGNLAEFLYKAAFPRGGSLTGPHIMALEALLTML